MLAGLLARPGVCVAQNQSLKLDGKGSYVLLPPNLFTNLTEATIEVWVKWETFGNYSRVFEFGAPWRSISLFNEADRPDLRFNIYPDFAKGKPGLQHYVRAPGVLRSNEWIHIAAVSGPGGMLAYVNGQLVGQHTNPLSFAALRATPTNVLGLGLVGNPTDKDFCGEMDELRVWNHRRSMAQIRGNMFKRIPFTEPGLEHLWNFDDGTANDATLRAAPGKLRGAARIIATDLGLVGEVAPVAAKSPPTPTATTQVPPAGGNNLAMWWVVGGVLCLVVVLVWIALTIRRFHRAPQLPAVLAGVDSSAPTLKQQALQDLTHFAKESLVQGLYSQRQALIEAQAEAYRELGRLEARLTTLQLPERIQAYEERIAELEKELTMREGELREMTLATLQLLREKVAEERRQESPVRRFN